MVSTQPVVFSGYVFSPTGFGTAARSYIHALHSSGLKVSVLDRDKENRHLVPDPLVLSLLNLPVQPTQIICHIEPLAAASIDPPYRSRVIGLTAWESDRLPAKAVAALNQLHEVWVPSRYNAEAFRRQLRTPVFQLPHPLHLPLNDPGGRAALSQTLELRDKDFLFLAVGTWQRRKNLPGVIEAFARAFADEPYVKLAIKTSYGFVEKEKAHMEIIEALERAGCTPYSPVAARMLLLSTAWTEESMTALFARADCYVSLHRSEGWCYPLFEAAANGTPVVATASTGPMDYLDARYHHLVGWQPQPAIRGSDPDYFPFDSAMQWAEPDVEEAARQMRQIYDQRVQARQQARAGAELLHARYNSRQIGLAARERLQSLGAFSA